MMIPLAAAGTPLLENTEFWVAMSFVCFVLILVYYRVPGLITGALDKRADAIRRELDDARKLREEAQALLADYQRRAAQAETEANEIVVRAEADAKKLAEETRQALAASLERRTRLAEEKIARAEAQAIHDVRSAAVDRAVLAAEKILKAKSTGPDGDRLVSDSIKALPNTMN
ncbi:MAG: F0F1 ATP synthase subunit B [Pseudomonadota bacterium]